ncbi:serum amyloid P-component-like [Alligator mississippiensis]|uniref:C-reactive protein n=1 Tax=Alligator mississippiensis TaxID=8496 RepID=A0A151MYS8_ALLMI|nr:serum amyloid P-component-like [Alligator mississippiensis]
MPDILLFLWATYTSQICKLAMDTESKSTCLERPDFTWHRIFQLPLSGEGGGDSEEEEETSGTGDSDSSNGSASGTWSNSDMNDRIGDRETLVQLGSPYPQQILEAREQWVTVNVQDSRPDLFGQVFVFPRTSATAHVVLGTKNKQPLQSFTVCLRYFSDLTRNYTLFSYASKVHDNEILLFRAYPGTYTLSVAMDFVTYNCQEKESPEWVHICASWESATGIAELWVDGKPLPRKGLQKDYSVKAEASILLGQDQDTYAGEFDEMQSFVGEITDLHMWDRILTSAEIRLVRNNEALPPHAIDWRNLAYEIKHYVVLKPSLSSMYRVLQAAQNGKL